ncbi:MAG TPA: hypothetical protein VJT31_04415 [Rugosimonospora sp.]|nr:hypothetical protein [Rugosimonospora sp.]
MTAVHPISAADADRIAAALLDNARAATDGTGPDHQAGQMYLLVVHLRAYLDPTEPGTDPTDQPDGR